MNNVNINPRAEHCFAVVLYASQEKLEPCDFI